MTKKKNGDDYGLSKHSSEASLDAALAACVNDITNIEPSKVVADVHKQLITKFQPAMKSVAETGFNLLRAFQNVQKMSEAYVKSIDMLAESGNKAYPAAKQRAAELKELASCMNFVSRRHKETINKFSFLIVKINAYGHDEKDKLKDLHRGFETREKAMKKSLRKKNRQQISHFFFDPNALEKFYIKERNLALKQQYQRYKFFVDKHSEWLRDYISLFDAFKQIIGESPILETGDCAIENETEVKDENVGSDDDGYVAAGAYLEQLDSVQAEIHSHNDSVRRSMLNRDEFFNENFTTQHPELEVTEPASPPEQFTPPGVVTRYRDIRQQPSTADKGTSMAFQQPMPSVEVIRLRDTGTMTASYENYPQEPLEPPERIPGNRSSLREPILQPLPSVRRNISERIASLSMTALNEGPKDPDSTNKEVMFRLSNINAVPTAFVQQAFMASDYGKMLVCIHDFHGQTANQLSLKAGEKVVLIKCGSKGWVFTKNVETQRTGWFPSRYVQILPDSPASTHL